MKKKILGWSLVVFFGMRLLSTLEWLFGFFTLGGSFYPPAWALWRLILCVPLVWLGIWLIRKKRKEGYR